MLHKNSIKKLFLYSCEKAKGSGDMANLLVLQLLLLTKNNEGQAHLIKYKNHFEIPSNLGNCLGLHQTIKIHNHGMLPRIFDRRKPECGFLSCLVNNATNSVAAKVGGAGQTVPGGPAQN